MVNIPSNLKVKKAVQVLPKARKGREWQKNVLEKRKQQILEEQKQKDILQTQAARERRSAQKEARLKQKEALKEARMNREDLKDIQRLGQKTLEERSKELEQLAQARLKEVEDKINQLQAMRQPQGLKDYQQKRAEAAQRQKIGQATGQASQAAARGTGAVISSNVDTVNYRPAVQRLYITFLNGSFYEYDLSGVPDAWDYFMNILHGDATCRTSGTSQYNGLNWWVGKSPSVGAAVWKYLREAGVPYRRIR